MVKFLASSLALTYALLPLAPVQAQVSSETAPLASYTAIMGKTTVTLGGTSAGGSRNRSYIIDRTNGVPVYINLTSYSPRAELQAISQAGQGNVVSVLNRYNHGTVSISSTKYPINAATSFRQGNNYRVNLVSSKPFNLTGQQGGTTQGTSISSIVFTVPVSPEKPTTGAMYSFAGGRVSLNGTV